MFLSSIGLHVVYVAVLLGTGFGLGRIKNKAKLAAINADVKKVVTPVDNAVKTAVTDIKSKL
jgi:hypothetical protein